MKALLTEYSTTSQSTNFGMSLDFHAKCKKTFEVHIFILHKIVVRPVLVKVIDSRIYSRKLLTYPDQALSHE